MAFGLLALSNPTATMMQTDRKKNKNQKTKNMLRSQNTRNEFRIGRAAGNLKQKLLDTQRNSKM